MIPVIEGKKGKEPIGHELSCDDSLLPELKDLKTGGEIELSIKAVKVGEHIHSLGKKKEHMVDLKILEIECDEDEDDNDEQE